MRVMVMVKATPQSEAGEMPSQALWDAMGKFNDELTRAGVLLAADGLKPSRAGARIRFEGTRRAVLDGPFAETKELVAGFWIWQVRSLEEAIEWGRRCPNPFDAGTSEIEIRPFYEPEDFGELTAAELRGQQERIGDNPAHRI